MSLLHEPYSSGCWGWGAPALPASEGRGHDGLVPHPGHVGLLQAAAGPCHPADLFPLPGSVSSCGSTPPSACPPPGCQGGPLLISKLSTSSTPVSSPPPSPCPPQVQGGSPLLRAHDDKHPHESSTHAPDAPPSELPPSPLNALPGPPAPSYQCELS